MADAFVAELNGIRMKYVKFGRGDKNFVIIPGLSINDVSDSAPAIKEAFAAFSEKYTVYLFDRRADVPIGYSIEDMSDDTYLIMRSLGIERADIFGASQGGMIAMNVASNHPEFAEKAVIGSSAYCISEYAHGIFENWVQLAKEGAQDKLAESLADLMFSEDTLSAYRQALIQMNLGVTEKQLDRFAILANSLVIGNVVPKLDKMTCKTLVIGCEGDKIFNARESCGIAEKLGCELYIYPAAFGHAVYDEAPDYRSRMLEFLQ